MTTYPLDVDARRALKDLHNGSVAPRLKNLSRPFCAIAECEGDDFVVHGLLDIFENDQGPVDTADRVVCDVRLHRVRRHPRVRHRDVKTGCRGGLTRLAVELLAAVEMGFLVGMSIK
jgi:hypothetical protein